MDIKVSMPKIGKDMTQGTVVAWEKKSGEQVAEGDVLLIINNGKMDVELEADVSGTLKEIVVAAGAHAPVNAVLGIIEEGAVKVSPKAPVQKAQEAKADGRSLIVVGGGPGGYVAAIRAAQLGAKVTLVEKNELGGTCLNRGCMPTKAMLHASEVYETMTSSASLGLSAENVNIDWSKVQANRANVVKQLTGGVASLMRANKIRHVTGEAVFTAPRTVKVGDEEYSADRVIIATGSAPIIPNIPGLRDCPAVIDSTACLELDHIPESLAVIGGGVIGLELGTVYRRFGTKVTVIEKTPKLLPLMDAQITQLLQAKLEGEGLEILCGAELKSVETVEGGAKLSVDASDGERIIEAEKVLVCVGRGPLTKGLNLESAGIECTERGFIKANDMLETSAEGIYAIGDCTGKLMLAHAAMAMGEIAAENAMGESKSFNAELCPSCAYIGPEFAGVGYTEEQAKIMGLDYQVGLFPTSGNGRSLVAGHTDGLVKIISGKMYGEVLGVHILAPNATELIGEASLAIKLEATLDEMISLVHSHPTVSEALREAAMASEGRAVHIPNKKKK